MLNPQTSEVIGQTAARHTSQEFVSFLDEVVSHQSARQAIHLILDNFATHKTIWRSASSSGTPM
jgi:hypothetical protein